MKRETFENTIGMQFVSLPPATFMMGSPKTEPDRSEDEILHRVTLSRGFWMQTTQVTQAHWKEIMGTNPSEFQENGKNRPVESVAWIHVQYFIRELNKAEGTHKYRLPTEAEWEFACRAGTDTPFFFGECLSSDQANYDGRYPLPGCAEGEYLETTLPVASFPPNAWGLYDMHGNVWEWCQDRFGEYPDHPVVDPAGPSKGADRIARGGGWASFAQYCRSAFRFGFYEVYKNCTVGFRLVLDF